LTLPPGAREALRVGGGDINEAYRARLPGGEQAFVKTRMSPHPGEYASEAAGLRWLAEPGMLRTPAVLDVAEGHLALQWLDQGALGPAGWEELGRGLALTHAAGAPCFGDPGFIGPARLGPLVLPNDPAADWVAHYSERRLQPLAAEGERLGRPDRPSCPRACTATSGAATYSPTATVGHG
jgi:fructosamine-3-kinase